jgi:predicted kinase
VISDSVNPVRDSRDAWLAVAHRTGSRILEVEFVCSDVEAHRRRVETRRADIPGLKLPTWEKVVAREYEPWSRDHLVIDTAEKTVPSCTRELEVAIARIGLTAEGKYGDPSLRSG